MGYELRRMLAAGAPSDWTVEMRIVAFEIADDARDPILGDDSSIGLPWSALPIKGHVIERGRRHGEWQDGLVEILGMSERRISRALTDLARTGYEMRQVIGADKNGKPMYAAKGHAMRFVVPPLAPREPPQSTTPASTFEPKHDASVDLSGPKHDASVDPSPQRPIPSLKTSPHSSASDLTGTGGRERDPGREDENRIDRQRQLRERLARYIPEESA